MLGTTVNVVTTEMVKTDEGTAAAIVGQKSGATSGSLAEMNAGEGAKLTGIEAGATVGGTVGTNIKNGGGTTLATDQLLNNRVDNNVLRVPQPVGGSYNGPNYTTTGAIKITLPVTYNDSMLTFQVRVYNYSTGQAALYTIGGYLYAVGASWYNESASMVGPDALRRTVRFGHDGSKCCVWIGETDSGWSHPQIQIENLVAGYAGNTEAAWRAGWSVSIDTNAATNVTRTVAYPNSGEAVMGKNILENSGGAVATRSDYRTDQGMAAALLGQTAITTATTILPSMMAVRDTSNIIKNPDFFFNANVSGDGWRSSNAPGSGGSVGLLLASQTVLGAPANAPAPAMRYAWVHSTDWTGTLWDTLIPAQEGEVFEVKFDAGCSPANIPNAPIFGFVEWYDSAGTLISNEYAGSLWGAAGWQRLTARTNPAPAGAATMHFFVIVGNVGSPAGYWCFTNVQLRHDQLAVRGIEDKADVTASNVPTLIVPERIDVASAQGYLPNVSTDNPLLIFPRRLRGPVEITTDDDTDWSAIASTSVTGSVDTTDGSITKGRIMVTGISAPLGLIVCQSSHDDVLIERLIELRSRVEDRPINGMSGEYARDFSAPGKSTSFVPITGRLIPPNSQSFYLDVVLSFPAIGPATFDNSVSPELKLQFSSTTSSTDWTDYKDATWLSRSNGYAQNCRVSGTRYIDAANFLHIGVQINRTNDRLPYDGVTNTSVAMGSFRVVARTPSATTALAPPVGLVRTRMPTEFT